MIVPVITVKDGKEINHGNAIVKPNGDDFTVEFYITPERPLSKTVLDEIAKELKKSAKTQANKRKN